jgi:uncharacterized protein (DUF934 family)
MSDLVQGGFGSRPVIAPRRSVLLEQFALLDSIGEDKELLVPLVLWLAPEREAALAGRDSMPMLVAGDDPYALESSLATLRAIAINFADFNDGRGYSSAVLLRKRLGFEGQLRATGDVLRDQLFLLLRCGFDAFEPRADRSTEEFIKGFRDFRDSYQESVTTTPLFRRRAASLALLGEAS